MFRPCKFTVRCVGNLGNQIISLLYALHSASVMQSDLEIWGEECYVGLLQASKSMYFGLDSDKVRLTFQHTKEGEQEDRCYGNERSHAFLNHPLLSPTVHQVRELYTHLHSALTLYGDDVGDTALNTLVSQNSTLTIYMRSGDIFLSNFHPSYIQAPCAYYDAALQTFAGVTHIVIITSTTSVRLGANPCVTHVLQSSYNVTVFTGSVRDSYVGLLHARHLVLSGVSSFGSTAALLSKHTHTLVLPMFFPASIQTTAYPPVHGSIISSHFLQYKKADCRWAWPSVLGSTRVHRFGVSNYPPTPVWSAKVPILMHNDYNVSYMRTWPVEFQHPWSNQLTILTCFLTMTDEDFQVALREDLRSLVGLFKYLVQKRYVSASLLPSPVVVLTCQSSSSINRWFHRYFVPELPLYLVSFLTVRDDKICGRKGAHSSQAGSDADDNNTATQQYTLPPYMEERVLDYVNRYNMYKTTHAVMYYTRLLKKEDGAQLMSEVMHRILYEPTASVFASPNQTYVTIYKSDLYSVFRLTLI
ncbi:hypothetical protein EON65_54090 [archaeon]|nr:MAG: hypothetical protein EON65_54090 [archaeon]